MQKLIVLLLLITSAFSQVLYKREALSDRNANYNINVRLEPESRKLYGSQVIEWRNISSIETNELWFHLYLNGFSGYKTTFAVESGGGSLRGVKMSDGLFGQQKIKTFIVDGEDLFEKLEFRQPDDGNIYDSTVVMVTLNKMVKPGMTVKIEMDFEAILPKVFARTGFVDVKKGDNISRYFLVGQWFPKIAVLENRGWNCHQFHANTEFFSDYGEYHVKMQVPSTYVVGASGELLSKDETSELTTYHYYVNDVHDFAWTAYQNFEEKLDEHNGVQLRLLYDPDMYDSSTKEQHLEDQMQAVKHGLDYYANYGKYPHPTITMLNSPPGGGGSDGMEYPTFFTCGYNAEVPDGILMRSEYVTIHEFGHQIFQGVLGSNEMEHSWMDEGLNSYADANTVDHTYGAMINFKGITVKAYDFYRLIYMVGPNYHNMMKLSFTQNPSYYGTNSYMRPAVLMKSLENYVGADKFYPAMQHYFNKWKFKHPYPKDLFEALQEKIDVDIMWYVNQFFYENKVIDYDVEMISTSKENIENFVPLNSVQIPDSSDLNSEELYKNKMRIVNHGDGYFKMDLEITLEDGSVINDIKWDPKKTFNQIEFYSSKKIVKVQLDPKRKALIDLNYTNNGRMYNAPNAVRKYTNRWTFWLQNLSQLLTGF